MPLEQKYNNNNNNNNKPADRVQIVGTQLYIVKDGGTHEFKLVMRAKSLPQFKNKFPINPEKLCDAF